jgi:hypothetical protein
MSTSAEYRANPRVPADGGHFPQPNDKAVWPAGSAALPSSIAKPAEAEEGKGN